MQTRIIVDCTYFLIFVSNSNPCTIENLFKKSVTNSYCTFLNIDDFEDFCVLVLDEIFTRKVLSWFQAFDKLNEKVPLFNVLEATGTKFTTLSKE